MTILVTGGAGYIGSHTCLALLEAGHHVTVLDNLSNGSPTALMRVQAMANKPLRFIEGDIRKPDDLRRAFDQPVEAVVHFAALKAVGESCHDPLTYFDNNISGTIALLRAMSDADVRKLVFSSSATVYGQADTMPVTEQSPLGVTNPYGRTKLVMEQLIADYCAAPPRGCAALLRYFNPVGAHSSGRIGEDPTGIPNNLMPFIAQVAVGARAELQVFGNDYPTRDGTGIRDYLHVMDLADAHVKALHFLNATEGCNAFNLGTGRGCSVLELVAAFERASGRHIPYRIVPRRAGDVAELWADASLAKRVLGWQATFDINTMCRDTWHWQSSNPHGYRTTQ